MIIRKSKTASQLLEEATKLYNEWVDLKPGQIIYVDNLSKFIIPDGGDDSEEYW